jgi:hypothetical protein
MLDNKENVIALFNAIISDFPNLSMRFEPDPKNVDVSIDIASQPGLPFDINLNLQGDELHLVAGSIWNEWFPGTDPKVIEDYREAFYGLLSGQYRIVEQYLGTHLVKAKLQKPQHGKWNTIATWTKPHFPFLWGKSIKILQAQPGAHSSSH